MLHGVRYPVTLQLIPIYTFMNHSRSLNMLEALTGITWGAFLKTTLSLSVSLCIGLFLTFLVPLLLRVFLVRGGRSPSKTHLQVFILVRLFMACLSIFLILESLSVKSSGVFHLVGSFMGVGLSFSLRDPIANVFCGFAIVFSQYIDYGDELTVYDKTGTVLHFTLQHIELRSDKGQQVLIPNVFMMTNIVFIKKRVGPPPGQPDGPRLNALYFF